MADHDEMNVVNCLRHCCCTNRSEDSSMKITIVSTDTDAARLGPTRYLVVVAIGLPYPAG